MTFREDLRRYPKWMLLLIAADAIAAYGFLAAMVWIGR